MDTLVPRNRQQFLWLRLIVEGKMCPTVFAPELHKIFARTSSIFRSVSLFSVFLPRGNKSSSVEILTSDCGLSHSKLADPALYVCLGDTENCGNDS